MNHKQDTDKRVCFYENEFYPLSNFSAFKIKWKGLVFDTSEAVYHWEKFVGVRSVQGYILNAPSAHEAFKIAEANKDWIPADWKSRRVEVMLDILRAKADQHEYVRRKLLETGSRTLVEDSWRDDFWGEGPDGNGQNMLGKLWEQVRAELQSSTKGR